MDEIGHAGTILRARKGEAWQANPTLAGLRMGLAVAPVDAAWAEMEEGPAIVLVR